MYNREKPCGPTAVIHLLLNTIVGFVGFLAYFHHGVVWVVRLLGKKRILEDMI